MTRRRPITALILAIVTMLALSACESDPTSQAEEGDRRQASYDQLVSQQPGQTMTYSPTRETINFWVETWDQPGRLSFVYMIAANGQPTGYYVLEGLPVSYCAMLTPNWELLENGADTDFIVNAPGIDGAYYSGGQCNQYYGKDATTGAFLEWSIGSGQQYRLSSEPLPYDGAEPLGFTTVEDVQSGDADG